MPFPVPGRVAETIRRSTVQIRSGDGHREGNGSGVVLGDERVVTNAHVIQKHALIAESWEGKSVPASVVKMDRGRDLALLNVTGLKAPSVQLGDSDDLRPGTPVLAVGNPFGFIGAVSTGIVHSIGPVAPISSSSWIHADIRLAPGNSGGPLADLQGRVIGINTMIITGGIALAIPSRSVQSFLTRGSSPRSLGVVVRPIRLQNRGVGLMILELVHGGPAERASLLPGDILVAANDKRFRFIDDLQTGIDEAREALLRLEFYRAGQEKLRQVAVRLDEARPQSMMSAA